jgi:hypothetical protein
LNAQSAERALAGKEIPGDPSVVLLCERDFLGRADYSAGCAAGAQAYICSISPRKGGGAATI